MQHCKRCGTSPVFFDLFDPLCAADMAQFVGWENTLKIAQEQVAEISGGSYVLASRGEIDERGHYPNPDGAGRFQFVADGKTFINDSLDALIAEARRSSDRLVEPMMS